MARGQNIQQGMDRALKEILARRAPNQAIIAPPVANIVVNPNLLLGANLQV
jgi:hypothetical protein